MGLTEGKYNRPPRGGTVTGRTETGKHRSHKLAGAGTGTHTHTYWEGINWEGHEFSAEGPTSTRMDMGEPQSMVDQTTSYF
jgi:hypothetical protein